MTKIIERTSAAVWLIIALLFALPLYYHVVDESEPYTRITVANFAPGDLPSDQRINPNAATQTVAGVGANGRIFMRIFHYGVEEGAELRMFGRDFNHHVVSLNRAHEIERRIAIILDGLGVFASIVSCVSEFLKSRGAHGTITAAP